MAVNLLLTRLRQTLVHLRRLCQLNTILLLKFLLSPKESSSTRRSKSTRTLPSIQLKRLMFKVLNIPEVHDSVFALPLMCAFLDTCFVVEFRSLALLDWLVDDGGGDLAAFAVVEKGGVDGGVVVGIVVWGDVSVVS